jgi:hypothetical protein
MDNELTTRLINPLPMEEFVQAELRSVCQRFFFQFAGCNFNNNHQAAGRGSWFSF